MQGIIAVIATLILGVILSFVWLHREFKVKRVEVENQPGDYGLEAEQHWMVGKQQKKLFAWWIPASDATTTVIITHGWGSSATELLPLALPFHRASFNVLLFDSRNHGHSDSHGFSSMPRFAEDLHTAIDWLEEHKPGKTGHKILLGHSVGAGATLLEASRRQDYSAVISLAAFSHPESMMRGYLKKWPFPNIVISAILEYVQWKIGNRFDDIAPMNTIKKLNKPVLLVHGKADTTVTPEHAQLIFAESDRDICQLLLIEDAKHDSVDKIEQHGNELVDFIHTAIAADSVR